MTFPTAEDKIVKIFFDFIVDKMENGKGGLSQLEADLYNLPIIQQIISEHETVERLKSKITDVERALNHLEKNYPNDREEQKQVDWILLKNLKSILENKNA